MTPVYNRHDGFPKVSFPAYPHAQVQRNQVYGALDWHQQMVALFIHLQILLLAYLFIIHQAKTKESQALSVGQVMHKL